jgi:O-antigen/teichoic acid export membrane protein
MAIFSTTGVIVAFLSVLLATVVVTRMKIPAEYLFAARVVLVLTGFNIAITIINGLYAGILIALHRFDLSNGTEVASAALRSLAIVVALQHGLGLISLALLHLFFNAVRLAVNFVLARKLYPQVRISVASVDRQTLRLIFSFSVFSFLLHTSLSLIYASDLVVIGAYLPVSAVTFYVIGATMVEYARSLVSGITQTMSPLASSAEAKHDSQELRALLLKGSRWATMAIIPVAATFLIRGSSFIALWMGPQFADLSGHVLKILAVTLLFNASGSVVGSVMLGISRHKPLVPVLLAEGLCNLVLSIFLVKRIGIVGVAWGTLLPNLLTSVFFYPWYARRVLKVNLREYGVSAWLKPVLAAMPFLLLSLLLERFWPAQNLVSFFLQVALCLLLLIPFYWRICLDSKQRSDYSRRFAAMIA